MLRREDGSTLTYWLNDFARPDWQDYVARVAAHYVREYDVDDYRIDACYGSKEYNWDPAIPYARASHAGLKGMRSRATGVGATNLLKGLGITAVAMPAPAIYENLQKGVVDGALAEFTAVKAFRIGEVTKTHIMANVSSALLFIGMNKAKLASLPPDLQNAIRTKFSGPAVGKRAAACWSKIGKAVAAKLKEEGHVFVPFAAGDRAAVMPVANKVTDDYLAGLEAKGKKARDFHKALTAALAKGGN
jgi:TRAP-type C4-dicarboxylate transport system substrate-binding protein